MPKLISFDIGIKNLAYCIFDFSNSNSDSTTKIIDWNVLDISKSKEEESEKSEICSCIVSQKTKTKKINQCKKKAKYQKDNNNFYCETHAKKSGFLLPIQTKQFSHSFLKKLSLEKLLELETNPDFFPEIQIQIQNENQKKETKAEKIERIYRQFQEKSLVLINKAKKAKSGTVDLIEIGRNLHKQLSSLKHLDGMDYVLIENQISPIANKMKTIQGMVTQIFIMRDVPNIEFISSVNKLRGFSREKKEEESEEEEAKKGINPNYKQHKKDGIEYCQQWLQKDIFCSWNSFFEKYPKKQDDLADSFLQGIWYLQKMKIL